VRRLLMLGAVLAAAATQPSAQTPPGATSPADAAARALKVGQYDEVDTLLGSQTDARAVTLRARAAIARGRYDEAEKLLARPAGTAPTSDAALELGLLQLTLGRRDEGLRLLTRLLDTLKPRTAADFLRFGAAARAVGALAATAAERKVNFDDAVTAFQEANRLAPMDPAGHVALGELSLDVKQPGDAGADFQNALKLDDTNPPALVGFARAAIERNPPDAQTAIERALATNPNYEPAHLLAAEIALDDRRRDEAKASIGRALAVNPNSLEARSLDAAVAFLEGRTADFDEKVRQILALNPRYGEVYRVVGDHAARNYRFDEAVVLVRKGLALDPDNKEADSDLGMHLLRTGDEPAARQALERSFAKDNLDYVTFNLLDLLDRLDKFDTVREGNITMRFAPEEAGVMREEALPLAREALDTLSKRWNFPITDTVLIEMFPKHDDFAVRNLGLPGMIGALGACFGRVVTLDSPRARPPGEYNWQPTLWHELAHVITLTLSNNRVPRWVTEGISVWEERRARPQWGREMEVAFAHALEQGQVLKLKELNDCVSDPQMISLAYHEASLVVEHLGAVYGDAALKKFLQAFGRGLEIDAALKDAFNASMDDIQKSFDAKLERDYGAMRRALKAPEVKETPTLDGLKALAVGNAGSFPVQMSLGSALAKAGDAAGAIQAYERAAKLVPSATGDDNPNKRIAQIAFEQKDTARAIRALEDVLEVDHADVESARLLVSLVAPLKDSARMQDAYQRLSNVDPFDSPAHSALGRLALQRRDVPVAVREFRAALATTPPDPAAAHVDLGEAYLLAGRPADAKAQALAAVEIAPAFERAQDLLLKVVDEGATR
jgi:tetratricopeptide (TPR) repeat protein